MGKMLAYRKRPPAHLIPYLERWRYNSPGDLGIIRFGFEATALLNRDFGVADWVKPTLEDILRFKPGMKKEDRAHAICTFRDGSKTTWMQILCAYLILVGQYGIYWEDNLLPEADYIRYRSKTWDDASQKVDTVITIINSDLIVELFGGLQPTYKEVRDKKFKSNLKLLMFRNNYWILPLGLDQSSRGNNIRGRRPKADFDDDVENKNNTKTPESRKWNEQEVIGEQFGGLADDGLTVFIFNMVHQDCLGRKLLKSGVWHRRFFQLSYFDKDGVEHSSWDKRFPMERIKKLEAFFRKLPGGYQIFRREYYNEILADVAVEIKSFKGEYEYREGHNWVKILKPDGSYKWVNCYIIVSGDPAISEKKKSSDAAIAVVAFCSDKQRRILNLTAGKMEFRDRVYKGFELPRVTLMGEDLIKVERRGMVDEMVRKIIGYHADQWVMEKGGQQRAWSEDIEKILEALGKLVVGSQYYPQDEKTYKLRTGLLNVMALNYYEILEECPHKKELDSILRSFPMVLFDLLDSIHNAEVFGHFPEPLEYDPIRGAVVVPKENKRDSDNITEMGDLVALRTNEKNNFEDYLYVGY